MKAEELLKEYKAGKTDFIEADLSNQNLSNCTLIRVDLSNANLSGADLRKTVLERVRLNGANLTFAKLNPADLSGCDLRGANLQGAKLDSKRTKLLDAIYDQDTQFPEDFDPIGALYRGVVSENIVSLANELDKNSIQIIEKSDDTWIENSLPALPPPIVNTSIKNDNSVEQSLLRPIDELDTQVIQEFPKSVNLEPSSSLLSDTQLPKESLITYRNLFFIGAGIGVVLLIPTILFLKFTETSRISNSNSVTATQEIRNSTAIKPITKSKPVIPTRNPSEPKAVTNSATVITPPITLPSTNNQSVVSPTLRVDNTVTNSTVVGDPVSKNIRTGPGTEYGVIAKVNIGDRLLVKGEGQESNGFIWYKVYDPKSGAEGWIGNHLLSVDNTTVTSNSTSNTSNNSNTASNAKSNATIVGEPGSKNIRSGPGTQYSVLYAASPGDRVQIMDKSTDIGGYIWYKVYSPDSSASGWIAAQLINLD